MRNSLYSSSRHICVRLTDDHLCSSYRGLHCEFEMILALVASQLLGVVHDLSPAKLRFDDAQWCCSTHPRGTLSGDSRARARVQDSNEAEPAEEPPQTATAAGRRRSVVACASRSELRALSSSPARRLGQPRGFVTQAEVMLKGQDGSGCNPVWADI